MNLKEKVVCLYVMIDEDQKVDIDTMLSAMRELVQKGGLSFNNYALSVEDVE